MNKQLSSIPKGEGMEKVISLCKRRGFIFPGSEIYGGLANSWDYGPLGVELKNNIKNFWWKRFVQERDDMVGLDSSIIVNPKIWEASGHLKEFSDPLIECKKCHSRFRADDEEVLSRKACQNCGKPADYTEARQFNMMLKTFLGSVEDTSATAYLRPETAQGIFVNFKNILDTARRKLPFGVAQIGKAFRNEITPGNFIFRTREFEQMEIEYFIPQPEPDNDESWRKYFEMWQVEMMRWIGDIGINSEHVVQREIEKADRAHYSRLTVDFEYQYPFGQKELYGLAYRGDFDLKNHERASGENLKYRGPDKEDVPFWPHVIEPTWGVDRSVLAVLLDAYTEEPSFAEASEGKGKRRVILKLKPYLAPYKAAVFPLLANKPDLVAKAQEIYDTLRKDFMIAWDDRGNIGKRYYSQDEIGTPYCITVDFDSLEKNDVTIRDRDSAKQERMTIEKLADFLRNKVAK